MNATYRCNRADWRTDEEAYNPGCEMSSRGDHANAATFDDSHEAAEAKLRAEMVDGYDVRANSLYCNRAFTLYHRPKGFYR